MYNPIIDISSQIYTEITKDMEGKIISKIKNEYNIDIDKNELKKLLKGDRRQYSKGYTDGYADGYREAKSKFMSLLEHVTFKVIDDTLEEWDEQVREELGVKEDEEIEEEEEE